MLLKILQDNGFFCSDGRVNPKSLSKLQQFPAIKEQIALQYSFLPDQAPFAQIVHAIKNNLTALPHCPVCNGPLQFNKATSNYSTTCSVKCGAIFSPHKTFKIRDVTKEAAVMGKRVRSRTGSFRKGRLEVLSDPEWLFDNHVVRLNSITEISNHLGVHYQTVTRALREFGISSPPKTQLRNASNTRKYGVPNVGMVPETRQKAKQSEYAVRGGGWRSKGEQEVLEFVRTIIPADRVVANTNDVIPPKELDIWIPSQRVAIEFCGLYWHSDRFKEPRYHANKMKDCSNNNVRLLMIFEDEWKSRREIVQLKIQSVLGLDSRPRIYGRKTDVVEVDRQTKKAFFDTYHVQGNGPGSKCYGLEYEGNLVAVMSFISRGEGKYELSRYATSSHVIGGFGKLLAHFKHTNEWDQVVSFADIRWSDGRLYETTGWHLDSILPPDYYWVKSGTRFHKFGFRHKHLQSKLQHYDPRLSENDNCKSNGYVKIYNCGLKRYVLTRGVQS